MSRYSAKALVALLTALLSCCFLLCVTAAAADPAATSAVVLHTSLVDLFNADRSQWAVSLTSSATPTTAADATSLSWTEMREVWVEAQPGESAASLLFALPPPTSSYYRIDDTEAAAGDEDGSVSSDDVLLRAQQRQLFGQPSHAFHGLSCEEYGAVAARQHRASAVRGRCYLMRDGYNKDVFFNYRVEAPGIDAGSAEEGQQSEESKAAAGGSGRRRRGRVSSSSSEAAAPQRSAKAAPPKSASPSPQTTTHASEGAMWTEVVVLPGAETGVVGTEEDVHVGAVHVTEQLTRSFDSDDSTRVQLTLAITMADTKTTLYVRLSGVTGAYCVAAARLATMEQQASRTSIYNRWIFPVVYTGGMYALLYGVAWLQARRKASAAATAGSGSGATAANGSAPPTAAVAAPRKKKQ